ncbi:MAG: DUF368 domain-containing protein [Betaproteobacteria bacterium AqS2]|uniref:DUF368 domain-containing protein n=1 Tax=Candidatus Amphirhobacter heronislandensis TaxID=1732024 RepID=A0A930UHM5_9GAMM|nr:DUF368 domain-containing protein [Betaproteobacteria bacterium AqS2]
MHPAVARHAGVFARGMLIGIADLIPGVSGGTIAFITGIYERLLNCIRLGSSPAVLLQLLRGEIRLFWRSVDGSFLAVLLAGAAVAIFAGADLVHLLLAEHTALILAFFLGLTLSAAAWLARELRPRADLAACAAAGLALALAVGLLAPAESAAAPPLYAFFAAGALALCAMILPGISGSLLLLLFGFYPHLIEALHQRDLAVIAVFAAGGIGGLALFARLLGWILRRWRDRTLALLIGVMLGAVVKLWPWKEPADGVRVILQANVLPAAEPGLAYAAVLFAVGCASVFAVERAAQRMRQALAGS